MTARRNNNFDALRLIAALTVIVGHAWPLTGIGHPPAIGGIPIFTLAVYVFFALSGFLVATSWIRDRRVVPFLLRRVSRIFPALIVLVLLTVFVVGPLTTTASMPAYFASGLTWMYLTNASLLATYKLPGVFADHPRPVVNGSLWTLGPEFSCYLGVAVIGLVLLWVAGRSRRHAPRYLGLVTFAVVGAGLGATALLVGDALGPALPAVKAMVFFASGAMLAQLRVSRLPLSLAGILGAIWITTAIAFPQSTLIFTWLALPYVVLAAGSCSWPVVRSVGRFGDFSYGVYLWGFLVQQVCLLVLPDLWLGIDILLVAVFTIAIAVASWHLVEKRCLEFGRRIASRAPRRASGTSAKLTPAESLSPIETPSPT